MRKYLFTSVLAATVVVAAPNPLARFATPDATALNGRWNGVDLELRSNCRTPENNGSRGTYAQFDVTTDAAGNFAIGQSGITGLNCSYVGTHRIDGGRLAWQGSYNCTDGKRGDFRSTSIESNAISLDIRLDVQLTSSEACTIDAILGMSRFPP